MTRLLSILRRLWTDERGQFVLSRRLVNVHTDPDFSATDWSADSTLIDWSDT